MRTLIILATLICLASADDLQAVRKDLDRASKAFVQSALAYVKKSSDGVAPIELGVDPKKSEVDRQRCFNNLIQAKESFMRGMAVYVDDRGMASDRAVKAGVRWASIASEADAKLESYDRALAEAVAAGFTAGKQPAKARGRGNP